jgi:hypothetical protein
MVLRQKQTKIIPVRKLLASPADYVYSRNVKGRGVFEVGVAVTLLIILALLVTNVSLMSLAREFNTQVCTTAAKAGANAAAKGADHHAIAQSVLQAINDSSVGGVLIEHPCLYELHFDSVNGQQRLVVGTLVKTRVPAPLLLWSSEAVSPDGMVVFSKTVIINIKAVPA